MKIGTIDMNRAFKEYNKTKDAEKKINDAKNAAKKEYDDRADTYKKALDEINKLNQQLEAPALSADAKTQKAKERDEKIASIKNMEREINEFRQTREKQLQEQAVRMRDGIVQEITGCRDDKGEGGEHGPRLRQLRRESEWRAIGHVCATRHGFHHRCRDPVEQGRGFRTRAQGQLPARPRPSPNEQINFDQKTHAAGVRFFCPLRTCSPLRVLLGLLQFASRRPAAEGPPVGFRRKIDCGRLIATLLQLPATGAPLAWEKTVTLLPRGDFPNPRPLVATYNFGWNGLVAATAEMRFDKEEDTCNCKVSDRPLAWFGRFGNSTFATAPLADAGDALPDHDAPGRRSAEQNCHHRCRLQTRPGGADPHRYKITKAAEDGALFFRRRPLRHALHAALRSQPAATPGDVYRVVVYPATSRYLATITVTAREQITTPARALTTRSSSICNSARSARNANSSRTRNSDTPASGFRTIRTGFLLRVEANIFVGKVFAELQSVRFPDAGDSWRLAHLTIRHQLAPVDRPSPQPARRRAESGLALTREQTKGGQRFHVEPAIRHETRAGLEPAHGQMRARPELAIDPAPIIAVAGQKRLCADDDVPLQIGRRNFVGSPRKHVTHSGPRLAGSRSICHPAGVALDGSMRRASEISADWAGGPLIAGLFLRCRRSTRLGGGTGPARAHA